MIAIYSMLCMSANILTGLTQKISLGFAAFYGVGAYISALSVLYLHLSLIPAVLLILLVNTLLALLIALPSLRLKGDYFILVTLGFQIIVYSILYNWTAVTKGPFGISGISDPVILGSFRLDGIFQYFIFSIILTGVLGVLFYYFTESPFGRVLRALGDDELALLSLGRNIYYYKITAFVLSSAFTGIAGYIYATYISYIDPTSFTLDESIFILSALIIGGLGTVQGAIWGAVFVVLIPEILRFVGLPDSIAAPMRQIIYGVILIWVIFYRPQGIAGIKKYKY
jgi:branched-chain amino acid transport system permease protein